LRKVFSLALPLALLVACGDGGTSSSGGGAASTADGSTATGFETAGSGTSVNDCADDARLVYLVSNASELLRFDPATLSVTLIGKLGCSVDGGPAVGTPTPVSMAVERNGTAWVLYDDGTMHLVDVATAGCDRSMFQKKQVLGFDTFGMGFVSNAVGTNAETLYVAAHDGSALGIIDRQTLKLERVGEYSGNLDGSAELTGTGDSRLFGFFLTNPVQLVELDKVTAKTKSQSDLGLTIGDAWAFAFWGGDFWLFTSDNRPTSEVHRYRPSTGQLELMIPDVGYEIVGAGVSTCAPITPPS
jgi:hypothetical protein